MDILTSWMVYLGCQSVKFPLTNIPGYPRVISFSRLPHQLCEPWCHYSCGALSPRSQAPIYASSYLDTILASCIGILGTKIWDSKRNKSKTSRMKTWRITKHQRDQCLWRTPQRKRVHQKQEPCFIQRTGNASEPPPFPPGIQTQQSRDIVWYERIQLAKSLGGICKGCNSAKET